MLRTALIRLTAGVLALAGSAAAVVPAATAGQASFVVTVDHRDWRDHRWEDRRGDDRWDRRDHWDRRDRWERRQERRADRRYRVKEICEPTWRVKRSYDRYGRVDKVVRVRVTECRLVRR